MAEVRGRSVERIRLAGRAHVHQVTGLPKEKIVLCNLGPCGPRYDGGTQSGNPYPSVDSHTFTFLAAMRLSPQLLTERQPAASVAPIASASRGSTGKSHTAPEWRRCR